MTPPPPTERGQEPHDRGGRRQAPEGAPSPGDAEQTQAPRGAPSGAARPRGNGMLIVVSSGLGEGMAAGGGTLF